MDANYQRKLRSPKQRENPRNNNSATTSSSPYYYNQTARWSSPIKNSTTSPTSFSSSPVCKVNNSPPFSPPSNAITTKTSPSPLRNRTSPCKARRKLSDRFIPLRPSSSEEGSSTIITEDAKAQSYNDNTNNDITFSSYQSPLSETNDVNYNTNSNINNEHNNNNSNNDFYSNMLSQQVLVSPKRRLRFNDDEQKQQHHHHYSTQHNASNSFTPSFYNYNELHNNFASNNYSNSTHYYHQRPPRPQSRRRTTMRTIPTEPRKVLDAPCMSDDYYLNLLDWGSSNIIAVGLCNDVFLYNATTSKVSPLCHFESDSISRDMVTSVCWMPSGTQIAVGTHHGTVELWDVTKEQLVRVFNHEHNARVGALSSYGNRLASGSKDKDIMVRDLREPDEHPERLFGHNQEVCGLRWSLNGRHLASGGNDNRAFVWNPGHSLDPLLEIKEHEAAVKAIAWSPHHHGLLATGGGSADQTIRLWDINRCCEHSIQQVNTGSQVCNLIWATTVNELVSGHGYSQYQIMLWEPHLKPIVTLTGHSMRVLHLTLSPDGQTIASGAADETIRLWQAFPPGKAKANPSRRRTSAMVTDIR